MIGHGETPAGALACPHCGITIRGVDQPGGPRPDGPGPRTSVLICRGCARVAIVDGNGPRLPTIAEWNWLTGHANWPAVARLIATARVSAAVRPDRAIGGE